MLAEQRKPRRSPKPTSPKRPSKNRSRTAAVLSKEIAFIPHESFRDLDRKGVWKQEIGRRAKTRRPSIADGKTDERKGADGTLLATGARSESRSPVDQMCETPLLSPDEERDLFCRMNYLKYRANALRATLDVDVPNVKKLNEIDALVARSTQLRNRIVSANTRLVVSIVKSLADELNSFDDLLSEGIGCLLRAVEKFNFGRGFRFSTYATLVVRRGVFRYIKRCNRDRTRFTTGTVEVLDQQTDAAFDPNQTDNAIAYRDRSMATLISKLDEREQFIVKARYGFIELGKKPTFSRLGEKLGVSKERVRQLEMRALGKLREFVGDNLTLELDSFA